MAEFSFNAKGKRWSTLARLIAETTPNAEIQETDETITIKAPYITITREMIEKACFPNGVKHSGTLDKILYGLALIRKGRLVAQTKDRIVVGDDDGERAITVRLRLDQLDDITRLADRLGMSRNQFILTAIERFVEFLEESQNLPILDEKEEQP